MKKILLTFSLLLAAVCQASAQQAVTAAAGSYKGELYISLGTPVTAESEPMEGQSVDITASAANADGVDFAIHNFSFGDMLLGDILLPGIGVSQQDGHVVFGKNDEVQLTFPLPEDGAIYATANLDETQSVVKGDSLIAYVNVVWYMSGFDVPDEIVPIYVVFKGAKEQPAPAPVDAAVGHFSGDLFISLGTPVTGESEPMPDQSVDIDASEDKEDCVDFAIHNFSFGDMLLGDILLPSIGVSQQDSKIVFGKNDEVQLTFPLPEDGVIYATASLDETQSYIEGDSLVAYVNVVWYMSGFDVPDEIVPIYVVFKGKYAGTTSIAAPVATEKSAAAYDLLTGRKVNAAAKLPRGLYFINGKKTLVK